MFAICLDLKPGSGTSLSPSTVKIDIAIIMIIFKNEIIKNNRRHTVGKAVHFFAQTSKKGVHHRFLGQLSLFVFKLEFAINI